jgi:hypothetical protein
MGKKSDWVRNYPMCFCKLWKYRSLDGRKKTAFHNLKQVTGTYVRLQGICSNIILALYYF